jgi:integrase
MSQSPPVDQRIVDEYFQLALDRKTKNAAWLYGMVATYGLKPDELIGFEWSANDSIHIPGKKRPVFPLHPQWVLLFGLKKNGPT